MIMHARARPLRHRQVGGHEGHRVLLRLRPPPVVDPQGRDRVRRQGHPRRRLREDHRDEQPRARSTPPTSPAPTASSPTRGGMSVAVAGVDHALRHGLRARLSSCSSAFGVPRRQAEPDHRHDQRASTRAPAPAVDAGFKVGDRIVSVDGQRRRPTATTLPPYIRASPGEPVDLRRRARRRASCTLDRHARPTINPRRRDTSASSASAPSRRSRRVRARSPASAGRSATSGD